MAVLGDGDRDIEPDQVEGAEGGAPGPADEGPGQLVDLVDPEPQLLGQAQGPLQRVDAQAIGDEGRRVPGAHRALAEMAAGVGRQALDHGRVGRRGRDQLQEPSVAGRVEEVRAQEGAAEGVGAVRLDGLDADATGIRADDRPGVEGAGGQGRIEAGVEFALRAELFDDRLEHPVGVRHGVGQLVEAARPDPLGIDGPVDGARPELQRPIEACRCDIGVEIEQADPDSGGGQQARDLGAHGARPEDHGGADAGDHSGGLRARSVVRRGPGDRPHAVEVEPGEDTADLLGAERAVGPVPLGEPVAG